jgi:hypothetical protein
MTNPPYDPRDVLDSYVATLSQTGKSIIRDASELGYPKDIIKFVLRHCMKAITEPDKQSFLKSAYLSLGNFQELSEEERRAVDLLSEIGPLHPSGTALEGDQAKRIADVAVPLQSVMDKLKAEVAVLTQELKFLTGDD